MNQVNLLGRMATDPEMKTTASGVMLTDFTLAVPRRRNEEGADFIRVTAFGKTAEVVCNHVKKGQRVLITGRIDTSQYEKDGKKVTSVKVVADHLEFIELKKDMENQPSAPQAAAETPAPTFDTLAPGDDLPF